MIVLDLDWYIDDVVVDALLDNDQTQAAVLNDGSLHLVQLLRHFALLVLLRGQEEVLGDEIAQDGVAKELEALVVLDPQVGAEIQTVLNALVDP